MSELNQRVGRLSERQRILLAQAILRTRSITEAPVAKTTRLCAFITPAGNSQSVDTSRLRDQLRSQLLDYMVPNSITVLDELPRLSNGKVDERSLPNPQDVSLAAARDFEVAQTESERILEKIWCDLLCLDVVSLHDNFFEVGGDSITGIQLVSRAREAGLQIAPSHLNDYPTIAGLASVGTATTATPDDERRTGDAPLTPIQHWFLSRNLAAPNHWNQAAAFELDNQITAPILNEAIDRCLQHHDAMRARFHLSSEGKWVQAIPVATADVQIETTVSSNCNSGEFQRQASRRMGPFELETGPLVRFTLFTFSDGSPSRLLIVIHHLVIDNVSWAILTSDLERVCRQLVDDKQPSFPTKTTSFIEWGEQLKAFAEDRSCRESAGYWTGGAEAATHHIPTDHLLTRAPSEKSTAIVVSTLNEEQTKILLTESNHSYNTQTNDLLLTALGMTLSNWAACSTIRIDLEGHGREPIFDYVDSGQTVGWFTSFFPVMLKVTNPNDMTSSIKAVKEQLRSVPNRGLNYGVLRYLSDDEQTIKDLTEFPEGHVLFNYSGVDSNHEHSKLLKKLGLDCTAARSPDNARSHLLEINAAVVNGTLSLTWIFSEVAHNRSTIERAANQFRETLQSLITHCSESEARGFTPSDVPETGLNQEELDQFLDDFE